MTIRDATRADLDEILALVHELAEYERDPQAVVFDPEVFGSHLFGTDAVARALVVEVPGIEGEVPNGGAGAIAGMALYYRTFSTWLGTDGIWLEDLFVRPEFRRLGFGRALLAELRKRTSGRVEWAVLDWNTPAHDFYRELGAAPLDEWTVWRWPPAPGGGQDPRTSRK